MLRRFAPRLQSKGMFNSVVVVVGSIAVSIVTGGDTCNSALTSS
jgi:hypothetical protein